VSGVEMVRDQVSPFRNTVDTDADEVLVMSKLSDFG
jgi:hypothetical protein